MAVQDPMAGELWSDYLARTGYQDPVSDPTQPQAGSQWAIPQGSTYDPTSGQYRAPGASGISQAQLGSTTGYGTGSGAIQGAAPAWSTPGGNAGAPNISTVSTRPYNTTNSAYPAGGGYGNANFGLGSSAYGQNPYLDQMAQSMGNQLTQNYLRNVQPSIGSQAMATGGYGGSRQGVVEANALNDMQNQYASGLASLYGNSYGQSLNYNLGLGGLANQAQANANSYNLGMNNNALGFANLDANINQNNVQNQLAGANFGLGLFNQGLQNANTGINAGTTLQNTPYGYYSNFANLANGIGQGYGTTNGTTSGTGSALTGALGGASLWNAWNRNNGGSTTTNMTGSTPYNPATADQMAASLNGAGYWRG